MIGELLQTAETHPFILVVTRSESARYSVQMRIEERANDATAVDDGRIQIPGCQIVFVNEATIHKYRGTVPVFYDPIPIRRAA